MRRRATAAGCCLALLIAAGLAVLLQSGPRRAGTNIVLVTSVSIAVRPGQQLCQPGEYAPADTASLRLIARSSGPSGPLRAQVSGAAGVLGSGTLAAGWRDGTVEIALGLIRRTTPATVCLTNEGHSTVVLGGTTPDPPYAVTVDGRTESARVRFDYMRPGSESWLQMIGVIGYRMSLGRSPLFRSWATLAVLVLMLAVAGLTVRVLLPMRTGGER